MIATASASARLSDWAAVLHAMAPGAKSAPVRAGLAAAMPSVIARAELTTPLRLAHFLAQCAHESDGFCTTVEYASGREYEGRRDLGNVHPGDGVRFKGRGLIQVTGRANAGACGKFLCVDFLSHPELLAQFPYAAMSAVWFWSTRSLNALADRDDIIAVTHRVNGGELGLASRRIYLAHAKSALAHFSRKAIA
jgi:putative chitinase